MLFYCFFTLNILNNYDHGIIPACTFELQEELKLSKTKLGLLQSLECIGIMIGSIIGGILFEKF